jgi:hypothetical protein
VSVGAESRFSPEVFTQLDIEHKMSGYLNKTFGDQIFRIAVLFLEGYHQVRHLKPYGIHPKSIAVCGVYSLCISCGLGHFDTVFESPFPVFGFHFLEDAIAFTQRMACPPRKGRFV